MGRADDQQSQTDASQNIEAWICLSCQLESKKDDRFCSRCGKAREEAQPSDNNPPDTIFEVWDADCDTEMLGILVVPSRVSKISRESLEKEKQSELLRRASFSGASAEELMASIDESSPKKAIIDLILSKENSEQQACATSCLLEEPLLTAPMLPTRPESAGKAPMKEKRERKEKREKSISRANDGPEQMLQIEEKTVSSNIDVEAVVKADEKETEQVEKKAETSIQEADANTMFSPRSLAIADPAVSELAKQIGIRDDEIDYLGWIAERGLERDLLPPRWSLRRDAKKGTAYYVTKDDQSLSWENPNLGALRSVVSFARRYMQRPVQETLDAIKESLWYEHKVSLQSWFGPIHDVEGDPYYVHTSGHSSWQDPREEAQFAFDLECILLDSLGEILSTRFPEDENGSEMQDVEATGSFRQILRRRSLQSEPSVTIGGEAPLVAQALPAYKDSTTKDRLANVAPPGKEEKIRSSTSSRLSHALANIQEVTEKDMAGAGNVTKVADTKVQTSEAMEIAEELTNMRIRELEAALAEAATRERMLKEETEKLKHEGLSPGRVRKTEPVQNTAQSVETTSPEPKQVVKLTWKDLELLAESTLRESEAKPEPKPERAPLLLKHTAATRIQAVQRGRAVRQILKADVAFVAGDRVEYYSDTYNKWLPAVVEERGDGFYKLNIKPRAEVSRMRKALDEAKHQAACEKYYYEASEIPATTGDTTQPSWMNDPQVRARRRSVGQEVDVGNDSFLRTLDPQTLEEALQNEADDEVYPVGTQVEYRSETFGKWVPGVVQDYKNGCYQLSCKPRAERNRVRRFQGDNNNEETVLAPTDIGRDVASADGTIERNITTQCAMPDLKVAAKVERPRPSLLELDSSLQASTVAGSGSAACLALRKSSSQPTLAKKKDRNKALTVLELEQKVRRRNDRFKSENDSMRRQIAQLREQLLIDANHL